MGSGNDVIILNPFYLGGRMRRLQISIAVFLQVFLFSFAMGQTVENVGGLKISSPAFKNGGKIPREYTCDGKNVNPPFRIENVPSTAKSLALVFDDIDAPRGTYVHWIVWNIDPGLKEMRENSVPEGGVQGVNDFKRRNYGGPCPPGRAHKYVLKIYGLDTLLNLNPNSTKKDLEKAMEGHIISRAQVTGLYKRN
jgi:Raf kinase inhibitor-like YbhB/YbcL family protein